MAAAYATIKVPVSTHQHLKQLATRQKETLAALLDRLAAGEVKRRKLETLRHQRTHTAASLQDSYQAETAAWDQLDEGKALWIN